MTDRITLRGMRFAGLLGVSDDERSYPQVVEVDLEIETDLTAASASDALEDTVNYGPLVELCRSVVEDGTHKLLEAIAGGILTRVFATTSADAATARVRKLAVPVDAEIDFAEVELRRTRPAAHGAPAGHGASAWPGEPGSASDAPAPGAVAGPGSTPGPDASPT